MTTRTPFRSLLATGALASTLTPLLATSALAQAAPPIDQRDIDPRVGSYTAPAQRYAQQGDPQDRGDESDYPDDQRGYYANGAPMPDLTPPPGYDGSEPPPPPPGYRPSADERAQAAADARYAADAERWARENCVKSGNNAGTGALVGGLLGAIIGSSVAGRHDRGVGAFAGAAFGAVGGAAVGSASGGETSPGCPPGYAVRRSVTYVYSEPAYVYAAPGWYRPWVYVGGAWSYRPYPYHDWYYRTYRRGPAYYGGYRGYRESWRGHGWNRRGW